MSSKMSAVSTQSQMESSTDDNELVNKFHQALSTNQQILCEKIDPAHGLWVALSDRKVLPDRTINSCKVNNIHELLTEAKSVVCYE